MLFEGSLWVLDCVSETLELLQFPIDFIVVLSEGGNFLGDQIHLCLPRQLLLGDGLCSDASPQLWDEFFNKLLLPLLEPQFLLDDLNVLWNLLHAITTTHELVSQILIH